MHSDQTANPLNIFAKRLKEITKKRNKTDEDHQLVAEIEFEASLYYNKEQGYYMPSANLDASFLASGKQFRLGTAYKQAILIPNDAPFVFKHQRLSPKELFNNIAYVDQRTVKVQSAKNIRTRPIFREWSCEFQVFLDEAKMNEAEVMQVIKNAGLYVGIGDYRPRYGRFSVEQL